MICKLTDNNRRTHRGYQCPEPGVWFEATGEGSEPCTSGVLHYYGHPLLAALLNPVHANITEPVCWSVEVERPLGADGTKRWCKRQKLIERIDLPEFTTKQRAAWSILAAWPFGSESWRRWGQRWLSGTDRPAEAEWTALARLPWAKSDPLAFESRLITLAQRVLAGPIGLNLLEDLP